MSGILIDPRKIILKIIIGSWGLYSNYALFTGYAAKKPYLFPHPLKWRPPTRSW